MPMRRNPLAVIGSGDPTFGRGNGLPFVFARYAVWNKLFLEAMKNGMRDWAELIESEMQKNARWEDRTGFARSALRAYLNGDDPRRPDFANVDAPTIAGDKDDLVVVVTGFMDYNYWLEVRWGGRFAIMWPTMIANNDRLSVALIKRGKEVGGRAPVRSILGG